MNQTSIKQTNFGSIDGASADLFTLTNKEGNEVRITNYGGIVTKWISADKNGNRNSVVVGFDELEKYIPNHPHFGAIVGRYANRIAKGSFKLGDETYTLATNNGPNHLHGGYKNFSGKIWTASVDEESNGLVLSYLSKDGEEGYPGNLSVTVTYRFTDDNELEIEYEATTDKPTVVNLTNHCYFNLTGDVRNHVMDNILQINAANYTPVDATAIPTGEIAPVAGTAYDFTTPHAIGDAIDQTPGGYDHNYVLDNPGADAVAATITESTSGRKLEVFTDEPGLQFYTGNSLDGRPVTDDGAAINSQSAFCLETQHFPDSPNHPNFPSTRLMPGRIYNTITKYKLSLI
jgi:aldose 1-epimerase